MPARACTSGRTVLGRDQGPEALTVERPVEARQEEIRALLGPPTRGASGGAPARQAGGWRFESSRVDSKGREPDGDGTALMTRHDVVRLHDAPLVQRRVGQRQTASLTRRMPSAPRGAGGASCQGSSPSPSTVTEVEVDDTPGRDPGGSRFKSGRSPHRCGGSGIGGGPYPPLGGFDSRTRDHGPVAQPGSAAPLQGEGCGFDSRTVHHHHADVAQPGEARRSDRRQCRFESDRQYRCSLRPPAGSRLEGLGGAGSAPPVSTHLDVAQRERTGFGSRGLEVRALPSRPM